MPVSEPVTHVFGIRHHGPGSARSVLKALEALQPDIILVEGPPDAEEVLPLLTHAEMEPPVALLLYVPEEPSRSVSYPFALFSPEWQALRYGLTRGIPTRFIDLPQAHQLAMREDAGAAGSEAVEDESDPVAPPEPAEVVRQDPLGWLAAAAGYSDGERWWEHMVEQRLDGDDLFAGICEAMAALRAEMPREEDPLEERREAYMRRCIRQARKEGYERLAVVCGAWHAPALAEMPPASHDAKLLAGLPKVKVSVTWIPWTYGRLARSSGYGAGIESPGWYHHLWSESDRVAIRWMTRVASLMRAHDLDASAAHVIEAVRLAESLAALRDRPLPGLDELNEAVRAVFCFDSDLPMRLIEEQLIVGERLGKVPEITPQVPLQQDLARLQRRLGLPPDPTQKKLDLDLREPLGLARSHLLHRLALLGIPWGQTERVAGKQSTFHEVWSLQWHPEFAVALIEAGIWGNTVAAAAAAKARDLAQRAPDLPALTELVDRVLLADLPEAIDPLMALLQERTALTSDTTHLMEALPPLARVLRYGNVRHTDATMVAGVVNGIVARICVGLPNACSSLDDDAAAEMYDRLVNTDDAIRLLENPEHVSEWHEVLARLADRSGLHGLIAGRSCRLLQSAGVFDPETCARHMSRALSRASEPAQAAAWLEGFLKGSGLLLLHDKELWQVLDTWLTELSAESFAAVLPLLRRTFATFPAPERRQMGERVRLGKAAGSQVPGMDAGFDAERAVSVLPLAARLLGIDWPPAGAAARNAGDRGEAS
ncbi:MAG TPA: hypothetical protein GX715_11390 [Armatimonadetes bacterium]|nr:hypothetical protein [Armatimonadota bacterium]